MKENNISIQKILWNNPVSVSHIGRTLPQKIKHKLHVRAWFFHSWCSLFLLLWQDIYQKHLRWGRVCSGSRFDWDGRKCMVMGMVQSLFTGEYCRSCKSGHPTRKLRVGLEAGPGWTPGASATYSSVVPKDATASRTSPPPSSNHVQTCQPMGTCDIQIITDRKSYIIELSILF